MSARLEKILQRLPPDAVEEVVNFAEFLAEKQSSGKRTNDAIADTFGLEWMGALSDMKDKYESGVELQHAIVDEWADMGMK